MPNINKNIIMQAGAAVANATNKAAGLSASTPEPGSIISAIQLVNGGREIGPTALAHFTESVRNKLLSLLVNMELIQSGSGTPSPDNVRPIIGRTGLTIYVSPTPDAADATIYAVDWTTEAGTVFGGSLDVVSGVLTVDIVCATKALSSFSLVETKTNTKHYRYFNNFFGSSLPLDAESGNLCNIAPNAYNTSDYVHFYPVKSNGRIEIWVPIDLPTSTEVQIAAPIDTPITYQLTGQDIITLVGDNYIWSDSGDVTIKE